MPIDLSIKPKQIEDNTDLSDMEIFGHITRMLGEDLMVSLSDDTKGYLLLHARETYKDIYTYVEWFTNATGQVPTNDALKIIIDSILLERVQATKP